MYAFNKDRLQKAEYREIVNTVFSEVLKEKVIVDYVVKNDNEVKDQEELLKETIEGNTIWNIWWIRSYLFIKLEY